MQAVAQRIKEAVQSGKKIVLITFHLKEKGERDLEGAIHEVLNFYGKEDLVGPVHAAIRELVQNAAKANLKRIVFKDLGLDPGNPEQYEEGMQHFRDNLVESRIAEYQSRLRAENIYTRIIIQPLDDVLLFSVENRFPLYPSEEARIREKFKTSAAIDNLYDYYMEFSDHIEGAGMGIAMIEILLRQVGLDSRSFTIHYDPATAHTVGRFLIPLKEGVKTNRQQFQELLKQKETRPHELRSSIQQGELHLPLVSSPPAESHGTGLDLAVPP
ncbi:MAG: hypothetical protein CMN76_11130 [Spirochaetaceae bacterium]|nr:hypothetical protein [Spirochaetaceae bacterium]|tara:strand:- start:60314 stop:61126 length:813 start_codon:yes stop_codon:yes gene_type:complete